MIRAALYARFSTDRQSDASVDDQFRQCERLALGAGLVVSHRFQDRGISAGTAVGRPGYQALLAAARAGEFEVIIAEDISRLWRSLAEYGPRSAELSDLNVNLITCCGDDTRREGWGLVVTIKAAMAEQYRREVSYRTRRGLEGRALAGLPTGGRTYGYAAPGEVEPSEASVVRLVYDWAQAGVTRRAIAERLNELGHPAPRGGRWGQSTVSAMLQNPRYRGTVIWGKTVTRRSAADSAQVRATKRPEGPLVVRQAPELAIIA